MCKKYQIVISVILLTVSIGYGQQGNFLHQNLNNYDGSIEFVQIKTDSIFDSNQVISLLLLSKPFADRFNIEIGYSKTDLKTTSSIAKSAEAIAAINGGFFNMDSGGSVTYLEINDTVISRTRNSELKWGIADNIINGAIVITNDLKLTIHPARSDEFYTSSKQESAVLVTGPLLLLNGEPTKLPDMNFANKRHPRTCLCMSNEAVVFVTIDGRQKVAEGMNLIEVQNFLLDIGCIDAINLDGGGSTTMWIKEKGVVNFPSDKSGERSVANALLILKEDKP